MTFKLHNSNLSQAVLVMVTGRSVKGGSLLQFRVLRPGGGPRDVPARSGWEGKGQGRGVRVCNLLGQSGMLRPGTGRGPGLWAGLGSPAPFDLPGEW
jgi:hypothetical protein